MKKFLIGLISFIMLIRGANAQSAGDYRAVNNGYWNVAANWEIFDGLNWVPATHYPGENPGTGLVDISPYHEIRITASVLHPIALLRVQFFFDEYWTYELYYGTLTFSGESSISLTVSGNVYAPGIINVNDEAGSKSHTLFIGGSFNGSIEAINADDDLTVIFNSTASNTIIEANGKFQDVILNGNEFTVYWMTINGNLTFVNGIVKIPTLAYTPQMRFRKGATWSGASNYAYVDGWVVKEGDEPFTFPIGQNGIYAPLTISAPVGVTEILAAKYTRASAADLTGIGDPGLFNVSQCEYWDLAPLDGQSGPQDYLIDITVGWSSLSNCGSSPYITNVADVTLARYNSYKWDSHGGIATGTTTSGSVTWSGLNKFGRFTIGNIGTCKTPSGLTATNITGNGATLTWFPEPGAISYDVYYKDYPYWPFDQWLKATTTSTSVSLSGLNQAALYYYRVRANCGEESSSYRQSEFTTLTVCDPPTGLTTTNITSVSAILNWAPVPGATSYHVEYEYHSSWTPINEVITSTSYALSGLIPGSYYRWRVRANCPPGTSHYEYSPLFWTYNYFCNEAYAYEPNEVSGQAKPINLGATISAAISSATDVDWFKVTMPNNANTTLYVTLSNLSADYDLYVYDKNLNIVGSSTASWTATETVIINSRQRKLVYYIKVVGKNGAYDVSQCYNLIADAGTSGSSAAGSDPANEVTESSRKESLYPNPASEFVYLNFNSVLEGIIKIQIVNSVGQLVKQHPVYTIKGFNQVKINVNDIRPGMYILRINRGDLNVSRKFVIAR